MVLAVSGSDGSLASLSRSVSGTGVHIGDLTASCRITTLATITLPGATLGAWLTLAALTLAFTTAALDGRAFTRQTARYRG